VLLIVLDIYVVFFVLFVLVPCLVFPMFFDVSGRFILDCPLRISLTFTYCCQMGRELRVFDDVYFFHHNC